MGLFNRFPYTNFHELNLDWILRKLRELTNKVDKLNLEGIPSGGTTGQTLTKKSDTDYDVEWKTPESGGMSGDYLPLAGGTMDDNAKIAMPNGELDVTRSGNKEIQMRIGEDGIPYFLMRNGDGAVTLSMFDALLQIAAANAVIRFESAPQCVSAPESANDLVNKAYVDAHSGGGGGVTGDYLPLSGGILTGKVDFSTGQAYAPVLGIYDGSSICLYAGARATSPAADTEIAPSTVAVSQADDLDRDITHRAQLTGEGLKIVWDRNGSANGDITMSVGDIDNSAIMYLSVSPHASGSNSKVVFDTVSPPEMLNPSSTYQFTRGNQLVTKDYVDAAIAAALQ